MDSRNIYTVTIVLPSAEKEGNVKGISAPWKTESAVATRRDDMDRIVPEPGTAPLRGGTPAQRGKALTAMEQPDFRFSYQSIMIIG